jgi:hypothetical protein
MNKKEMVNYKKRTASAAYRIGSMTFEGYHPGKLSFFCAFLQDISKKCLLSLTLLFVISSCFNLTAIAQTRRAFLVGINIYEPEEPVKKLLCRKVENIKNLSGCINDVEAVKGILISRFYFKPENIHVLIDEEATRDNILSGIKTYLIKEAAPGDVCVFYFAGHGSRVRNSKSNEPDKKDETLVPADWYRNGDIRDKELKKLFNRILDKEANLTVIVDACHSGSISRGIPVPLVFRSLPESECDAADPPDNEKEPVERGALIISSARDFQAAMEKEIENGDCYGLFTWALLKVLRSVPRDEPTGNILLRVNTLMQSEGIKCDAALNTANVEVLPGLRNKPLFGSNTGRDFGIVAGVAEVRGSSIKLLAGFAAGIRKNCVLQKIAENHRDPTVRVRVTKVYGLNLCQAKVIRGNTENINLGDLFEIYRWAAPREERMRVWIPVSSLSHKDLLAFSRRAARLKNSSYIRWVDDPTKISPTHIMSWDTAQSSWLLESVGGKMTVPGKNPNNRIILKQILSSSPAGGEKPRFFLRLPLNSEMGKIMIPEIELYNDSIEILPSGHDAHYILVGRFGRDGLTYAWVLPNMSREIGSLPVDVIAMPISTRWTTPGKTWEENRKAAMELQNMLLGLVKIRAWLQLSSPPDKGDFPYRLALKHAKTGEVKTSGPLFEGEEYKVVLRAYKEKPGIEVHGRYVYVFSINSSGKGTLLFPRSHRGNSENYFPAADEFQAEIQLGDKGLFRIGKPFGIDTYFLLTTEEPIPNPAVLDFKGVRGPLPSGKNCTALEKLLYGLGSSYRGSPPETFTNWSIQRLPILSIPRKK